MSFSHTVNTMLESMLSCLLIIIELIALCILDKKMQIAIHLMKRDYVNVLNFWLFFYVNMCIYLLYTAANETAIKLNETLGIPDKTLDKSLQELQSDVDKMMADLRKRKLDMQEGIAQDELEWVAKP